MKRITSIILLAIIMVSCNNSQFVESNRSKFLRYCDSSSRYFTLTMSNRKDKCADSLFHHYNDKASGIYKIIHPDKPKPYDPKTDTNCYPIKPEDL